ncbi:MAG: leucine-rich repeat protein [Bacteroidales bacterium]|nr:leucine-rich repeat protein [Bacteroidales bacterium]
MKDKIKNIAEKLEHQIRMHELDLNDRIKDIPQIILLLEQGFSELKEIVSFYKFKSEMDEIFFFKIIKPKFFSKLIYYRKVYNIEMMRPNGQDCVLKNYFINELNQLENFYNKNIDFYKYYRSGSTHLDKYFFLRGKQDIQMTMETFYFERDPNFSTICDFKVAKIVANEMLRIYLNLPTSINMIPDDAFGFCVKLQTVVLHNSIKEIGQKAFQNCTSLKMVSFMGNIKSIGEKAFDNCNNMNDIYCSAATPPTIMENTFSNMTYMFTNLHVPEGTNETYASADNWKNFITIVDDAQTAPITEFEIDGIRYEIISDHQAAVIAKSEGFYSGDIVIPNKVEQDSKEYFISAIGDNAFKGCQNLTSISLPVALNTIGKRAFAGCHSLEKIVIPDAVFTIESDAFNLCYYLKEVVFGSNLKDIGTSAFRESEKLTRITCTSSEPPTLHEGVFSSKIYQTALVQIPKGSKAAYQTATEWKEFNAIVEEGEETGSYNSYLETGYSSEDVTKDNYGNTRISVTVYIKNLGENTITLKKLVYKDPVTEKISYTQEFNTNSFNSGVLAAGATKEVSYSTQKISSSYTYNRFWLEWYYEYKGNEYIFCSDPNDPLDVSPILSETGTTAIGIFDLNGKRISTLEKGINIIKYSDGTTKKVIVK